MHDTVVIQGRLTRKLNNTLVLTFGDGPGASIGVAVQAAADGVGGKLGVLFGFKNGGTGTHVYTPTSGLPLHVESSNQLTTLLRRPDGTAVGSVDRGPVSIARAADGSEVLRFTDHQDEPETLEAFRLVVSRPDGEELGELHVIRTNAGWSLGRDIVDTAIWWGHAGQSLKLPVLGTSLQLQPPVSEVERELLLAACVDIAIGLRPYGAAMA